MTQGTANAGQVWSAFGASGIGIPNLGQVWWGCRESAHLLPGFHPSLVYDVPLGQSDEQPFLMP